MVAPLTSAAAYNGPGCRSPRCLAGDRNPGLLLATRRAPAGLTSKPAKDALLLARRHVVGHAASEIERQRAGAVDEVDER
jgi:hypothetical protein